MLLLRLPVTSQLPNPMDVFQSVSNLPTPLQRTWRSSDRNSLNILADHPLFSHVPWLWDTWHCLLKKKCFLIFRTAHSPGSLPPPESFSPEPFIDFLLPSAPQALSWLLFSSHFVLFQLFQRCPGLTRTFNDSFLPVAEIIRTYLQQFPTAQGISLGNTFHPPLRTFFSCLVSIPLPGIGSLCSVLMQSLSECMTYLDDQPGF